MGKFVLHTEQITRKEQRKITDMAFCCEKMVPHPKNPEGHVGYPVPCTVPVDAMKRVIVL